eukprot:6212841-Pleurochrysis_carterae.AAC.3
MTRATRTLTFAAARQIRQGRSTRLQTRLAGLVCGPRHGGLVADEKLTKECVEALVKELAAFSREPSHSASGKVAMVVGKERLEVVLNLSCICATYHASTTV